jgi:hypothetical protein
VVGSAPVTPRNPNKEPLVNDRRRMFVALATVALACAAGLLGGCAGAPSRGARLEAASSRAPELEDARADAEAATPALVLVGEDGLPGESYARLAADGAWSWFGEPRAVFHEGEHRRTYAGYVTSAGDVKIAQFDHVSSEVVTGTLKEDLQRDDNASPAVAVRPDHRLMAFYSGHRGRWMVYTLSSNAEDVTAWGKPRAAGGHTSEFAGYTYPSVAILAAEDHRRYAFWRGAGFLPTFVSSERGLDWSEPRALAGGAENEPFFKIASDGESAIHMAFTNGHPRHEPVNSIYYVRYEGGAFRRVDGSRVGTMEDLPLSLDAVDLVYDANASGVRAWLWDVAVDSLGHPVIAYAAFPAEDDHRYRYARWDGASWVDVEVVPAGAWFPSVEKGRGHFDAYYSGGMALDQTDPSILYLSRPVGGVFEIERWTTRDGGRTWSSEAVTAGSTYNNVRPVVPLDHAPDGPGLIWMNGPYVDYEDFSTSLRMK